VGNVLATQCMHLARLWCAAACSVVAQLEMGKCALFHSMSAFRPGFVVGRMCACHFSCWDLL
jgi:hypothetical protein